LRRSVCVQKLYTSAEIHATLQCNHSLKSRESLQEIWGRFNAVMFTSAASLALQITSLRITSQYMNDELKKTQGEAVVFILICYPIFPWKK
jgi:hypothetical protein